METRNVIKHRLINIQGLKQKQRVKNKLNEDHQIMWLMVRLQQIYEREKLPRLKTNNKLIKLQEEINGVFEELLEEVEMHIKI